MQNARDAATSLVSYALACLLLSVGLLGGAGAAFADIQVVRVSKSGTPQAPLAIVLVHGFNSSADAAFKNASGVRWSEIMGSDDRILHQANDAGGTLTLASAAVYTIDYSAFTDATAASADVSIEDISRSIADKEGFRWIFRNHKQVWIIAHSMGGIVIKRALLKLSASEPDTLAQLLGLSLIAVPANGAPLANRASDTKLGSFFRSIWGVSDRQLRELTGIESGNSYLQAMRTDWATFVDAPERAKRLYLACAYEGLATPVSGLGVTITETVVVPQLYSDSKCVGEEARIRADHIQIVKPSSRDSQVHEWLFTTLRTALRSSRSGVSATRENESPQAEACRLAKGDMDGVVTRQAADGATIVSARRSIAQPDTTQRFSAMRIADEYAKGELVRYLKQYVNSQRFVTETEGKPALRESIRSVAEGDLRSVQTIQSCYVDGVAWVRLEHRSQARSP